MFLFAIGAVFLLGMFFFSFVMQKNESIASTNRYFKLGWYYTLLWVLFAFGSGWNALTSFSRGYSAGYIVFYVMLFLFFCWGSSCFVADLEMKRLGDQASKNV